jgi:hypothetical protein
MATASGVQEYPDNSVILIEEETGLIKSIYAQYIAASAKKPVCYITTRTRDDILRQMALLRLPHVDQIEIREMHETEPGPMCDLLTTLTPAGLVVVDPFSTYFMESPLHEFLQIVNRLVAASRNGHTFFLLDDIGVLPDRHEQLLRAMADGVIRVTAMNEGDKIRRYLNILKMQGTQPLDKMLPFTITDEGFLIDTRERHG